MVENAFGANKTIELNVACLSNVITISAISIMFFFNQEEADMELLVD